MIAVIQTVTRKLGLAHLFTFILLLVIASNVIWGFSETTHDLDISLMLSVSILGLLTSLVFAKSPISSKRAAFMIPLLGVCGIVIRFAQLGNLILTQFSTNLKFWSDVWRWPSISAPDVSPVARNLDTILTNVGVLINRVARWTASVASGQVNFDPVAITVIWSLIMWLIFSWASWSVYRIKRPLLGIIPSGILLAGSLNYTRGDSTTLLPLVGATLLLMVLVHYKSREDEWEKNHIDYAEDIRQDLAITTIPLILALITISGIMPNISIREIIKSFRHINEPYVATSGRVAQSLGLKQYPSPTSVFDDLRTTGLPRRHLIGSGPELSEHVVMKVTTGDLKPGIPGQAMIQPPTRYYWRGITYERYIGSGWTSGDTTSLSYDANQPISASTLPYHRLVHQEVVGIQDLGGLLYTTGDLLNADHSYLVAWRSPPAEGVDPLSVDAFGATINTNAYHADSLLAEPSITELRTASNEYPEWINRHYLSLPDTVPARLRNLALDLTATLATPYDRALAIESYLRKYPYTLNVPTPPPNRDVADYFLFELRKGYCDYYATSMVVLARAAGLPARLVIGYASGSYDPIQGYYIVTEADAHSWVEIYFPGIGWVEFEPTAGLPEIKRPEEIQLNKLPSSENNQTNSLMKWIRIDWVKSLGWTTIFVGLFFIIILIWQTTDLLILKLLSPPRTIIRLYHRLHRLGKVLTGIPQAGETPHEFADTLKAQLAGVPVGSIGKSQLGKLLSPAAHEIQLMTDLYARTSYSLHPPTYPEQMQAVRTWERLRWRLWLARIWPKSKPPKEVQA